MGQTCANPRDSSSYNNGKKKGAKYDLERKGQSSPVSSNKNSYEQFHKALDEHRIASFEYSMKPKSECTDLNYLSKDFRSFYVSGFGGEESPFLCSVSAHTLPNNTGNNQLLCTGEDKNIYLINYETGHVLYRWQKAHTKDINVLTRPFSRESSDGNSSKDRGYFFSASRDAMIHCWGMNEESPLQSFKGHTLNVTSIDVYPYDGDRLVSGSRDNCVNLWDVETGALLSNQDIKLNIIHFVRWIPSLKLVAQGGEDLTIRLWDTRENRSSLSLSHTLANFDYHPICCEYSFDNNFAKGNDYTIITGHNGFNNQGSMLIEWDLRMLAPVRHYYGHGFTVRAAHFLREREHKDHYGRMISASDDGNVKLWDCFNQDSDMSVTERRPLQTVVVPEGRVSSIDEAPGGKMIFALRSGCIMVWKPLAGDVYDRESIDKSTLSAPQRLGLRYRYIGEPAT